MDEYHMARRVLTAEVSVGRVRGRPEVRLDGWCQCGLMQQINDGGDRLMTVEAFRSRKIGMNGEPWYICI